MALVNYGHFMFGIALLFSWRLFHLIPYFKRTPYPTPGMSCVWFSAFGSIFLLVTINLLQNCGLDFDGYKALLPFILLVITLINFWGESFIAPTKSYLIALGIGLAAGIVVFFVSHYIILLKGLQHVGGYYELISLIIGIVSGILIGIFSYFVLKAHFHNWNQPLWEAKKVWDIINSSNLLFVITTIALIEGLLQLRSTSLLLLLTSL
ncbi:MAG: hypothetical protein ACTSQQ_16480 [Candidatus Helarchaeota archaeon]